MLTNVAFCFYVLGWKLGGHHHHHHHHHHHGPNPSQPGYYWQSWSAGQPVPFQAVKGGMDTDGTPIYVGRGYHNGDQLPAKVVPSKSHAYVAWGGQEITLYSCEILVQQYGSFSWVHTSGGCIPNGAVPVGHTSNGETLYAGRTRHCGSLCIGKVHPSHGKCYVPFGGKEHSYHQYEVLVKY